MATAQQDTLEGDSPRVCLGIVTSVFTGIRRVPQQVNQQFYRFLVGVLKVDNSRPRLEAGNQNQWPS